MLTDSHYFGGELSFLRDIRERVSLPLLRKDFVIDAYQIDEARVAGADAILLIASALEPDRLAALRKHALGLGLDALVEVHDERELEAALHAEADLIGVNNRNLHTFEVDLGVTEALGARLGERLRDAGDVLLVAESGIFDNEHLKRLGRAGARAFLVGESLMRQEDLSLALRRLRRGQ